MHKPFYLLLLLVHILLATSFLSSIPFWVIFSISFFLLSLAAIRFGTFDYKKISVSKLFIAIFFGILMYGLFFIGKLGSSLLFPNMLDEVADLYMKIQPQLVWHFVALFLIIIPGEELFWRGYIQKNIEAKFENKLVVIVISSLFYTSANFYTFNPLFLLATFAGGVVWGTLYMWKRNIYLTILSHLVFNLFMLVLFPLF
ncbi:CPBP family intramembrane glutamic endopeptidase [Bacillus timonensis]|uniref:CPBP family intramembrane glutamic endopeptidase n=1 Tax=Bacillus timonensis TaxID=1033734 RepID=UPI000289490C|nr:CPBP family intramembrane glutamic endopeptidase [Bacillus timonensis]